MSRLIAALVAMALVLVAPAAILSWVLSAGLQRDFHAQDATVRAVAGPVGILTGRVGRLRFLLHGAAVNGVTVREFRAELRGVRLDMAEVMQGRLRVRELAGGQVALVLDEDDVQRSLTATKEIQEAKVDLDDGLVTVRGTVAVLNATFGVEIHARLVVEDGSAVLLRVETLTISGLAMPPEIANLLVSDVNPLLRALREPVPVRFRSATVGDGQAVITGEVLP